MFRIATAAYSCCPLCSDSSRSCASCLLTAPMQAPSSTTVPAQRCAVWWSRLSNALMAPRALSSNPSVGSLSAPLPGSTAAGGSPRTGKTATTTHSPSSASPPSASCSDGSVILHEVFGRTLRITQISDKSQCLVVLGNNGGPYDVSVLNVSHKWLKSGISAQTIASVHLPAERKVIGYKLMWHNLDIAKPGVIGIR